MREWERWDNKEVLDILQADWAGEKRKTLYETVARVVREGDLKTVVDVGCGMCVDYPILKALGLLYVGVDVTPGMLERARKRFPEADLRQGDLYKLDFPNQAFDLVFSSDVLIHIPAHHKALSELARVCNKTLVLKLAYVTAGQSYVTHDLRYGFLNIFYGVDSITQDLQNAGFASVEVVSLSPDELNNPQMDARQIFVARR